jgi:NifB/MoaA-like Fe-S oxidoreductase
VLTRNTTNHLALSLVEAVKLLPNKDIFVVEYVKSSDVHDEEGDRTVFDVQERWVLKDLCHGELTRSSVCVT